MPESDRGRGNVEQVRGVRDPAVLAWLRLARVYSKMQRHLQQHVRRFGLSLPQFDVLAHIGAAEGISQQALAERLLVTKGNICGLLDRMAAAGLVERRADPADRRVNRLYLTPAGRSLFVQVVPAHEAAVARLMGALPPNEQRTLLCLLRTLDRALP
jgi:DNA-binding MarR family transcriptional regulator